MGQSPSPGPDAPTDAAPDRVRWTQRATEVCGVPLEDVYRPRGDPSAIDHAETGLLGTSTADRLEIEISLGGPGYPDIDLLASDIFVVLVDPVTSEVSAVLAVDGEAVTFTGLAETLTIGEPASTTATAVPVLCGEHAPGDEVEVAPLTDGEYELVVEGDLWSPTANFEQPISWAAGPIPVGFSDGTVTAR